MRRLFFLLTLSLSAVALPAAAQRVPDHATRDATTRLAVAALGRICLLNLGDLNATLSAAAPGGEFGFVDAPPDVAAAFLQERPGFVRVLRRAGMGAILLVVGQQDGICSIWSEYADTNALHGYLLAMVDKGGLKGGVHLLPLDAKEQDGMRVSDYYLMPTGWFARDLGKRLAEDGGKPLALVTSVSPPGLRPMEGMLAVSRALKQ
ncbi:conserved exported hypothetical protein [Candidatus Terasakiella magnetica]|nr:conserved exported hypothetical protein [Candidatus Terasakiella magnetica]